jgi:[acyl-carrier-protein] S-malonyltransferase
MFAVVFPGQGSQKPGMGQSLYQHGAHAKAVFDAVAGATGIDVAKLCFETDEETLRQTQNAQLALFTCGVAAWKELQARLDREPVAMAGHSVGEYAALAAAGVVSVEDGARLVKRRGEVMAASGGERKGTMAAVLGLEREALEHVCAEASEAHSQVVVANDNCPGQLVISGDVDAVTRAGEVASAKGAKRVLTLNVSGAFHSPLMDKPAEEMAKALNAVEFRQSHLQVISNVTAEPVVSPNLWTDLLERQLKSPVRWTESMQALGEKGVTKIVECGSGEILCGLMRRIDKEIACVAVQDIESLDRAVLELGG